MPYFGVFGSRGALVKKGRPIDIDPYSGIAVRLHMMRDDDELAIGSGVLWPQKDQVYLVTAWHCLSGCHYQTGQSLNTEKATRPNKIRFDLLSDKGIKKVSFQLCDNDGWATWLVHKLGSKEVDLAVIPVPSYIIAETINKIAIDIIRKKNEPDFELRVGAELFVIGFPRGLARKGLPLWKRASIAVEPSALFDQSDNRYFLVDTASREGLSGSVVIARVSDLYGTGNIIIGGSKTITKIVGIYSGRVTSEDALAAQIGIVWPTNLVEEIIETQQKDNFFCGLF